MTLHNNCTTNVTLGIAYILNNAIDAPGGQQCQSKYNVVDPPATFCAEYPCELTARHCTAPDGLERLLFSRCGLLPCLALPYVLHTRPTK